MKFTRVNENRIVITLTIAELESRNIDIKSMKDNTVAYQKLFWDMMERAECELGFDVSGSQLVVETTPDTNGNILISITKSGIAKQVSQQSYNILERMLSELARTVDENSFPGNIMSELTLEFEILRFDNIEDTIAFCKSIVGVSKVSSSLYSYENKYYLAIKNTKRNEKMVEAILEAALEFIGVASESYLLHPMLEERGKSIIKTKAIKTLAESF